MARCFSEPADRAPTERTARRRNFTGSPSTPDSLPKECKGLPDYWAVLFDRAAFNCPAGSSLAHPTASEAAAFQAPEPLSTGISPISGLITCGPLARLPTHQPPRYRDDCKAGYRPAGWALAGWGLLPQDDSSKFHVFILDSPF